MSLIVVRDGFSKSPSLMGRPIIFLKIKKQKMQCICMLTLQGFGIPQVGIQNTSSTCMCYRYFQVISCKGLGYELQVFRLLVVGVFVMCYRCQVICCGYLCHVLQELMLCVVGVLVIWYRSSCYVLQMFMSTSVCKNTYYNQFKMPTSTVQNA